MSTPLGGLAAQRSRMAARQSFSTAAPLRQHPRPPRVPPRHAALAPRRSPPLPRRRLRQRRRTGIPPRRSPAPRGLPGLRRTLPRPGHAARRAGALQLGQRRRARRRADLRRRAGHGAGPGHAGAASGRDATWSGGAVGALARGAGNQQPDRVPRRGGAARAAGRGLAAGRRALEPAGLVQAAHDGRGPGGLHRPGRLAAAGARPALRRSREWTPGSSRSSVTTSEG